MSILLTSIFFFLILCTLTLVVQSVRPLSARGALPLSFCAFIAFESVLLNILSLGRLVTVLWVVGGHGVLLFSCWVWLFCYKKTICSVQVKRWIILLKNTLKSPAFYCLVPLLIFSFHVAFLINAPNTYDSLTYHMARVAHWIQQGSVGYFSTNISRQNEMGPGAEYVILFFQLLSGKDYLAALPQFLSYILLAFALHYLLSVFRVLKTVRPFLVLLALSTPMAVMQITTTQNDLVCSLSTVVILIASLRLVVGDAIKMSIVDFFLLGMSLAVGFIVKPISLLVAFPFLLTGVIICLLRTRYKDLFSREFLFKIVVSGAAFLLVAGPDILRKTVHGVKRSEVYPLFDQWDIVRLSNPVRTLAQNLPWPEKTKSILSWCGYHGELITSNVFYLHQDFIGNPVQILALIFFSFLSLLFSFVAFKKTDFLWPKLLTSLVPLFSWCVFAWIVKNQLWITRLQLPIFILMPLASVYLLSLIKNVDLLKKVSYLLIVSVALFSVSYSSYAAMHNHSRSLDLAMFWGGRVPRVETYYNNVPIKQEHDFFIKELEKQNCSKVGLLLGADNVDYPLTWRLMQEGKQTRHIFMEEAWDWPCMIFVGRGGREFVSRQGEQWLSAGDYHTFYRNPAWEFKRASVVFFKYAEELKGFNILEKHNSHILRTSEGVMIEALGTDPQVIFPVFFTAKGGQLVLKMEFWSAQKTIVQIFYKKNNSDAYAESQSIKFDVVSGDNELFFFLPAAAFFNLIRFDPGENQNDKIIISRFEGRKVE